MTTIVLDGLNEEDFRRSIENRLREARPGVAVARLRALLAPYARPGGILPERFLTVEAADLVLSGWQALGEAVSRHDKPGCPVTALSIAFGWPGDDAPGPDAQGFLRPHIETGYFSDNAFPFSQSGRNDLLEGYSYYGCTWSGDFEAIDATLTLAGIDDLHGALAMLEAHLLASEVPDEECIRAGSLGACLLSALLVQAVGEQIAREGLPRPLCVMAGSSGVYPYFDAPVAGIPEAVRKAAEALEDDLEGGFEENANHAAPAPRYSSLLMTGIPRAKKRAVLVLNESDDEMTDRIAKLRNLNHAEERLDETPPESFPESIQEPPASVAPDPQPGLTLGGPLLAQKPARHTRDLNDLFGLTEIARSAPLEPLREPPVRAEPDLPPARIHQPVAPGFTLLEPDLQQRLQSLIAGSNPAIAAAKWPEVTRPADPPATLRPDVPAQAATSKETPPAADPVPQPAAAGRYARLRTALQDGFKLWLSKFRG